MRKQYIDYVDFGKRIAKQRKKLGLSQKALAEAMDCSCGYISRVENGNSKPAFEFVVGSLQL
jgi:transcriptional regulator with XRE-family HTH domain